MTESSDSARPTRAYHKGNVADDLRKAAERILATESLENISIRRLTREVGVAPANFYNHFNNLDDLLLKIASSSFDQAIARAVSIWSGQGSKPDLLIASATDFVRFCLRNKQLMRVMLRGREHDGREERGNASTRSFAEAVNFIYGDSLGEAAADPSCEQRGMAVGYIALTYGFALLLAGDRFSLDFENEADLSRFIRNGMLPFLDGSAATVLFDEKRES